MKQRKLLFISIVLAIFLPINNKTLAETVKTFNPVVKTSSDGTTLTFISATSKQSSKSDISIDGSGYTEAPSWCTPLVKKVVIESSLSGWAPTSTAYWFCGCTNLLTIEGLENINTENVTSTKAMFSQCSSLTILDLSSFCTSLVKNMAEMFGNCNSLTTVYVGDKWTTDGLVVKNTYNSGYMFEGCTQLVGEKGTTYEKVNKNLDYKRAVIDGGASTPGYFTYKANTTEKDPAPYVVYANGVITFYYDGNQENRNGSTYPIEEKFDVNNKPKWISSSVTTAVFDPSFADYRPESIDYWFAQCDGMTEIRNIEYLNTENVKTMISTFFDCKLLKTIDLSHFNTSKAMDMQGVFFNCESLTEIDVSGFDTKNVANMMGMFSGCKSLTKIDVSNFNTEKVTTMSIMFSDCSSLKTLDLHNFNTSMTTYLTQMFSGCSSLESVNLTSFNTENVTGMAGMFSGCGALLELDLSNFNTEKLIDVGMMGMFRDCTSLKDVNLSSFKIVESKSFDDLFNGCTSLKSLDLKSFSTASVQYMFRMFKGCSSLKTIYVSKLWNTDNVTSSNFMFEGCTNLVGGCGTVFDSNYINKTYAIIDEGESNPGYLTGPVDDPTPYAVLSNDILTFYYDNMIQKREGKVFPVEESYNLSNLPKWHGTYSTATIDKSFAKYRPTSTAYWFVGNGKMSISITELRNLVTDEVVNMEGMFYGCEGLEELDVTSFNTSNVINMKGMFSLCTHLKSLELKNFDTSNVTDMHEMFWGCERLESLDVTSFRTSKVERMSAMFSRCGSQSSLTNIDVTRFDTSNVIDFGGMFANCTSLTGLDVTKFNTSKATNMANMFNLCSNLTSLDLTNFNTSNVESMSLIFDGCTNLKDIDVRNFNTSKVKDFGCIFRDCANLKDLDVTHFDTSNATDMGGMFAGCTNLFSLDLTNFETSKVKDMAHMFSKCESITKLDLSSFSTSSVTLLYNMFEGCNQLKTIYVSNSWNVDAVEQSYDMFSGCTSIVGEDGTVYNESFIDKTKAHIGKDGYLTSKIIGDINGDGKVDAADIVKTVNFIKTKTYNKSADLNGDGGITQEDVTTIIGLILSQR